MFNTVRTSSCASCLCYIGCFLCGGTVVDYFFLPSTIRIAALLGGAWLGGGRRGASSAVLPCWCYLVILTLVVKVKSKNVFLYPIDHDRSTPSGLDLL